MAGRPSRVVAVGDVVVEVSVPSDAFALGRVFHGCEAARLEPVRFVPLGDQFLPYLWVETDDPAAFERHVRADERIDSLTAFDSTDDRTLYRIEWTDLDDEFVAATVAHDLVIEEATGTTDRWRFGLRGPDHGDLAAFRRALLDRGITTYVHRIVQGGAPAENPYGLTEIQRETLELAYREGYFDAPREVSLEDLGEMMGVSRQSVSRRIRAGLQNLLATTLIGEECEPGTSTAGRSRAADSEDCGHTP